MDRGPSWEANRSSVKTFSAFYGTRRFITAFTTARHMVIFWARPIQSVPIHPTSWRCFLIFSHLRLGLASGLFPSGLPTKILYGRLLSPVLSTCPCHLICIDFITRAIFGESTVVDCHVTLSVLAPSAFLSPSVWEQYSIYDKIV